jgi:hypothetical protein
MPTRSTQVRHALGTRDRQIKAAMQAELARLVRDARGRRWYGGYYSKANPQPLFCYSTQKITRGTEEGWASWVELPDPDRSSFTPDEDSYTFHRQRKEAKARAWNLWQGWRLARGLRVSWGSFA